MNIATATLTHNSIINRLKLKLIKLQHGEVTFKKISKSKTEVSSFHYKSVQNVVMTYIGTNDADIADALIYMKNK